MPIHDSGGSCSSSSILSRAFEIRSRAKPSVQFFGTSSDMAPEAMAELAKGRLRTKLEPLVKALQGRVSEHHRFLLRLHLRRLDEIERDLAELEARMAERMKPFRRQEIGRAHV